MRHTSARPARPGCAKKWPPASTVKLDGRVPSASGCGTAGISSVPWKGIVNSEKLWHFDDAKVSAKSPPEVSILQSSLSSLSSLSLFSLSLSRNETVSKKKSGRN